MNPLLAKFNSQTLTNQITLIAVWIALLEGGFPGGYATAIICAAILGVSFKQGLKELRGKSASA